MGHRANERPCYLLHLRPPPPPHWFIDIDVIFALYSRSGQMYIGDPRLKSEHALDRELLSLGITEGKRYTIVVDADLTPDTPYR